MRPVPASRTTGNEDPLMHPQTYPTRLGAPTRPATTPALHLLHGLWVASCPTCGFQLATARTQARCERRAAWYAWALVAAATCVSVAINVAHAPPTHAARLVAALPPVALLLAVELLMILARRTLAHTGAPEPHPAALDPHPDAPAAQDRRSGAGDARAAVAELVAQERAGARPQLTGRQVAAPVGVKERRAQVLLREFRATPTRPPLVTATEGAAEDPGSEPHSRVTAA
jgi:hypothetical protein